jgi:hypothetical protein
VPSDAKAIFRAGDNELKDLRRQEQETRNDPTMDRKAHNDHIAILRENTRQVQEDARKVYRS